MYWWVKLSIFRSKNLSVGRLFIEKVPIIYEMASTVDFAPLQSIDEHESAKIENNDNALKGMIISLNTSQIEYC